jgi:hypothetical protein
MSTSNIPPPSPSFINPAEKRKREEEESKSNKSACFGDGISLSLPSILSPSTSTSGCETLRGRAKPADADSPSAHEELSDRVEKAKNTVIPDRLSETVSITINDWEAVLTYEGSRANVCESKLFNLLLGSSNELIFSLCELDNNFNEGKGHSLETVVKALQCLFSGRAAHLKEDSADQLTLLCSYLSLAEFLQSDLLFNEAQALFIRGTKMEQLTVDQLGEIMRIAEYHRAHQVIDEVLDFCIDFLRETFFFKPHVLPSCSIELNDTDFKIQKDYKCRELIQNYGYLKRYLTVNLTAKTTDEEGKVGGFYAGVCKFCPDLQKITVQDSGECSMDSIEKFNEVFVEDLMPNLKQLLDLKLTIISPGTEFPQAGRNHILSKFISTVNSFPNKLKICLKFFPIDEDEDTATHQQHLGLLENLDFKKFKSLTLILSLDAYEFKELAFMQNLPIQKLIFGYFSSDQDYEEDSCLPPPEEEACMIPNLQEISTYPHLKEVILHQPPKHIREAARELPFKKLTISTLRDYNNFNGHP